MELAGGRLSELSKLELLKRDDLADDGDDDDDNDDDAVDDDADEGDVVVDQEKGDKIETSDTDGRRASGGDDAQKGQQVE